ncbi:MAG: hypothetical protein N2246_11040, partial [Candidatus Sumerlaeia bacterium]|nr:hypothetical protein [Candidatus Sumerlaeia bacterium]
MCADKVYNQFPPDEKHEREAEASGKLPQPEPSQSISSESSSVSENETQQPETVDTSAEVFGAIQTYPQKKNLEQEKIDTIAGTTEEAFQPETPSSGEEVEKISAPVAQVPLAVVKKQLLFLFIALFVGYAYFFQGGQGNYSPQFALTRSIIERQRLDVGGYSTGADIIVYNGKLYSNKAPGNALLGLVPFYIFWKLLLWLKIKLWLTEHL